MSIKEVFTQLNNLPVQAFPHWEKVKGYFDQLRDLYTSVLAGLDHAEDRQPMEESIKRWLEDLKDLAYDFEDILDEIKLAVLIEKLKAKSMGIQKHKTSMVRKLITAYNSCFTPQVQVLPLYNQSMISQLKDITCRFEDIASRSVEYLRDKNSESLSNQLSKPSGPMVNESWVYGRTEDKNAVVKLLLEDKELSGYLGGKAPCDRFYVIPIVGMGGVGKTTLAQLVYNAESVQANFDLRVWVSVSGDFDVFRITGTILSFAGGSICNDMDLNMLQLSLVKILSGKKILIVLDNIWSVTYHNWCIFHKPFGYGLPGSRIIVTTRDRTVALVVGYHPLVYDVKVLKDDDCLSILAKHAGTSFIQGSDLREVGVKLVKMCHGVPLAVETLGRHLYSKTSKREWEDFLYSKILDLPSDDEILPVFTSSYQQLPPHLKPLFLYCSIFPKDYEFDKNELVSLWMAEGLLEKQNGMKPKDELGLQYFNELVSRSVFQQSSSSNDHFVMQGFLHDVAQKFAGGTCHRLGDDQLLENPRHISFPRREYEIIQTFRGVGQVRGLRTFLPIPLNHSVDQPPCYLPNKIFVELVLKFRRLRVLSLSGYSITEVPSTISKLTHLRKLNFSGTLIVRLPDSIGELHNLETLCLCNCRFLIELPSSLGNLSKLLHLDISNTDRLNQLPKEIGKLVNLRTLNKIVLRRVGVVGVLGPNELINLNLLRGALALSGLQNVIKIEDAKDVCMRNKKELEDLRFTWADEFDGSRNSLCEQNVLHVLRPNENLRNLTIEFYGGVEFPRWVGDPSFCKLSSIRLSGSSQCIVLPPLGQLPELKILHLERMSEIECIGVEFFGNRVVFPKLETLTFDDMPKWAEWSSSTSEMHFPCLHHLAISKCPKLTTVSRLSLPVVHGLDLEECSKVLLDSVIHLQLLKHLKVRDITGLESLPEELTQLEVLEVYKCRELVYVWPTGSLQYLSRLIIAECKMLVALGFQNEVPRNLEVLEIHQCEILESLPDELVNLGSLRELIMKSCPKIISFCIPPVLKRLEIQECPALRNWSAAYFPNSLERLSIENCILLTRVHKFSHLTDLFLAHCDGLEHFPDQGLPPNLRKLSFVHCLNLRGLPVQITNMSSLVSLEIRNCSSLETFPNCNFPRNLSALRIWDSGVLKPLSEWGLYHLFSLREFSISGGFQELKLLADNDVSIFPASVHKFSIASFPKLTSLSKGLENLISLQHLSITSCPRLKVFPSDILLERLWRLEISECPHLSKWCRKHKNWHKVDGIPCLLIDGAYISRQG